MIYHFKHLKTGFWLFCKYKWNIKVEFFLLNKKGRNYYYWWESTYRRRQQRIKHTKNNQQQNAEREKTIRPFDACVYLVSSLQIGWNHVFLVYTKSCKEQTKQGERVSRWSVISQSISVLFNYNFSSWSKIRIRNRWRRASGGGKRKNIHLKNKNYILCMLLCLLLKINNGQSNG